MNWFPLLCHRCDSFSCCPSNICADFVLTQKPAKQHALRLAVISLWSPFIRTGPWSCLFFLLSFFFWSFMILTF